MYRASKIGASFAVMAAVGIAAPLSAAAQQGASMATPSSMSEAQSAPAGSQGAAGDSTAAFKAADRMNTRVCYCSLYGDCWVAETRSEGAEEPAAVKACGPGPGEAVSTASPSGAASAGRWYKTGPGESVAPRRR